MKMFIMNYWFGIIVMREDVKIVRRKEFLVCCVFGKFRRYELVMVEFKDSILEEFNDRFESLSIGFGVIGRV